MKFLVPILLFFFSFSLFAGNEDDYPQKLKNTDSKEERESIYLEWAHRLSQNNTKACDSIIKTKSLYVPHFSEEGKIALFITELNNLRLGGSIKTIDLNHYSFKNDNLSLVKGLLKYAEKHSISLESYEEIKSNIDAFQDPTRKSIFYAISSSVAGLEANLKLKHFNSAIQFAQESQLKGLLSLIYDLNSTILLDQEDFEEAILNHQKGISFTKENKLTANTISHLVNIGTIHFRLNDFKKAKESYLEARKLLKGLRLDFISGQLFNCLGELYSAQNKTSKSIKFYQKSLIKFYNVGHDVGLANVHKNIGKAYFDNGDKLLAKQNYELSLEFSRDGIDTNGKGELYYLMAQMFLSMNELNKAEKNIKSAIAFWKEKKHATTLAKGYLLYAKIQVEKANFEKANEYFMKYITLSDSLHQQETAQKVAELSELYKSEQKERKIIEQEKALEEELSQRLLIQNKLENSKQQNRLIIVILLISTGLFVAIFINIKNRNKQEQLKKKQKEIELQQTLLRLQMNPHFIFNAMSVIQSYIYDEDMVNSSKFLVHFSKLMRLMLENNAKEFIGLDKELEIINRYLVIQKMRFENRFDFKIEGNLNEDPERILIPPMMVQPFIENAIEHGDLDQVERGLILIKYEIVGDLFIFRIEDNGVGRKVASEKKKSVNSKNHRSMAIELTKGRITLLNEKYKVKGALTIEDSDKTNETGTLVRISTPFKNNY